jgi:AbrB family looped-hinge helix DNA binding protein
MSTPLKKPLSKLTAQGQMSVPAQVRKQLGVGPGSTQEWEIEDDRVVVRRAGKYSFEDIHTALFPSPPEPKTLKELKDGIRSYIVEKHARR